VKPVVITAKPPLEDKSAQAGVQVGKQGGHLLVRKATVKGRHHALAGEHHGLNLGIGCRRAAGQGGFGKDGV